MSHLAKMREEIRTLRDKVTPPPRTLVLLKTENETEEEVLKRRGVSRKDGVDIEFVELVAGTTSPT
jgi:hypothetical protein